MKRPRKRKRKPPMFKTFSLLAGAIDRLAEATKTQTEWLRSHLDCVTVQDLNNMEKRIMATQAEQAAQITADLKTANSQLQKLVADSAGLQPAVDELKTKIAELEAAILAGGAITPEMVELAAEAKRLTQTVDDNVPELPVPAGMNR